MSDVDSGYMKFSNRCFMKVKVNNDAAFSVVKQLIY